MSSANILLSAPHEDSHLYPQLQPDFRMQKVNKISAALNKEVSHYRVVAKNINVPRKLLTGALLVLVFFQRHLQARVFLLLVFLPQSHSAAYVELSLSLLRADNRQQKA